MATTQPLQSIDSAPSGPPMRRTKMARRRALVLLLVHVAIGLHIWHWLKSGETMSPLEPSESMEIAKRGVINAGLVFFGLTMLGTLLFGRFFCGWGCHVLALQDGCTWLLGKLGLKPRPLRSKLLMIVPALAFFYMFVYPFVARWAAGHGWTYRGVELVRSGFWETFPGPVVAILTFLVCGGAVVWFLGNKGFCTYACPYGAAFSFLDRFSPFRIRVSDACEGCGHCTATCTSNVLVHAEVRDFGAVVDPGCMKCLDCVSVCPTGALSVGFGKPAILTKADGTRPRAKASNLLAREKWLRKPSFSWGAELLMAATFAAAFFALRGLYGQVPFLMSLGLAGIAARMSLLVLQLFTRKDLKFQGIVLRREGSRTKAGMAWLAFAVLFLGWVGHSAFVQVQTKATLDSMLALDTVRTHWFDAPPHLPTPAEAASFQEIGESARSIMKISPVRDPRLVEANAWSHLAAGDVNDFESELGGLVEDFPRIANYQFQWAGYLVARNRPEPALKAYAKGLEHDPRAVAEWIRYGRLKAAMGDAPAALEVFREALTLHPTFAELHFNTGVAAMSVGDATLAEQAFRYAVELSPEFRPARENLAGLLCMTGDFEGGIAELRTLLDQGESAETRLLLGRALLETSQWEPARKELLRAAELAPASPEPWILLSDLASRRGDPHQSAFYGTEAQKRGATPR